MSNKVIVGAVGAVLLIWGLGAVANKYVNSQGYNELPSNSQGSNELHSNDISVHNSHAYNADDYGRPTELSRHGSGTRRFKKNKKNKSKRKK
jgi:hypothetical protein